MKDFDGWNRLKKKIQKRKPRLFKERDIFWCHWGENIGFEQSGDKSFWRPVLIYKKLSKSTCYVIPLTTSSKKHKYRFDIDYIEGRDSKAVLDQMRSIDSRRLGKHISVLNVKIFNQIRKNIRLL